MHLLVTGATGYIGGRLVPQLLAAGHRVRVLVRDPARIQGRPWAEEVEAHKGDLADLASLDGAFSGVEAAYYLVHSMQAGGDFAGRDRQAATIFAKAAQGIDHLVYLGGLLPPGTTSEHLRSRAEVGRILHERLPTTEFRAGPVIGSGSGPFEMVRYLTEHLPIMVAPKWIDNPVQAVGVRDALAYLVAALEMGPSGILEIGCPEPSTFRGMMQTYAEARGLRRTILKVPVLTPRLASFWVGLVTPLPNNLATPLMKGMVEPVVADTTQARKLFPEIEPMPYRETVLLALRRVEEGLVETRWSGALGPGPPDGLVETEGLVRETRVRHTLANPATVLRTCSGLGGERGWPAWNWAWRLRGALDRLVGGPGLRRGRRDPDHLRPGDALDLWRVEAMEAGRLLRLRAEMRLPGRAWLQWEVDPEEGGARLIQTAIFAPRGLTGALYWHALYPMHTIIFSALADAIVEDAEAIEPGQEVSQPIP